MKKRKLSVEKNEKILVKKGEYWSPLCKICKGPDVVLEKDTLAKVTDIRYIGLLWADNGQWVYDVEFADGTELCDLSEDEMIEL